jgi:hypothetical protein
MLDAILNAIGGDRVNEILGLSRRYTDQAADRVD